jgi:hypothetical protein
MESNAMASEELAQLRVRPVERSEEARYQEQMARHHYLGELPKIGETLWYVATWREQWVAQLSISAAALKCGVRDRWIGWDFRSQYGRLKLIANNSRFLILPDWHRPNIVITSSTGTTMRIAAASAPASAQRTLLDCAASRSASSRPSKNRPNPFPQ